MAVSGTVVLPIVVLLNKPISWQVLVVKVLQSISRQSLEVENLLVLQTGANIKPKTAIFYCNAIHGCFLFLL